MPAFDNIPELRGKGEPYFESPALGMFFLFEEVVSYRTDDSGVLVKMKDGNYMTIKDTDEAARFITEHSDNLHNQKVIGMQAINALEQIANKRKSFGDDIAEMLKQHRRGAQ